MDKDNEIWRDVLNYEGFYQVSNLGNIRSLDRVISYSNGRRQFYKGRRMSCNLKPNGYRYITLSKNQSQRCTTVAQVVAVAFLGHKPDGYRLVVDHINGVKTDDRASNLRIVTNRENNSSCYRSDRKSLSSSFTGVYWKVNASKWASQIKHKGVNYYLGYFDNENDAADCYQEALLKIKNGSFITDKIGRSKQ